METMSIVKVSKTDKMKEKIIQASIDLFKEKGFSFTVNDLAKKLGIAKKTVYKYFDSKDDIYRQFIIECFSSIHEVQDRIYQDPSLSIREKLIRILNTEAPFEKILPVDLMIGIDKYYPELSDLVLKNYETGWENVVRLINQGKEEGLFREDISTALVKELLIQAIKMNHDHRTKKETELSYRESVRQSVTLIIDGLTRKD